MWVVNSTAGLVDPRRRIRQPCPGALNAGSPHEIRWRAMKIVVLVKQVPDSGTERTLRPDDNTVDRASASNVINEMDEYAIEEAVKLKEAHGGEVTILTMGP